MEKKKILIIGGGFGGIRVALDLDKKLSAKEAEITLVDRNNSHLFLPALYEIGSAIGKGMDPYQVQLRRTVNIPYADIFEGTKVNFVQAEIVKVDLEKKEVATAGEQIWPYDYLVLGLGAETEMFSIPGVLEYTHKFKTVDEALFLNKKINQKQEQVVKFIVAGGGFNGIELAAELASREGSNIKIIEAMPQILPMVSGKERVVIRKRLVDLKIEVLENSKIVEVGSNFVQIERGERHEADFIIWTAGIHASSFLKNIFGLRLDEKGKMVVNNFLQAEGWSSVFGIGDNTVFIDDVSKRPVPALAYVAVDEGKIAAENIYRLIKNKHLKSYQPFYHVWIAPVGGKFAVAHLTERLTISGFWGWVIRELVDLKYFLSILPVSKAISLLSEEIILFSKND